MSDDNVYTFPGISLEPPPAGSMETPPEDAPPAVIAQLRGLADRIESGQLGAERAVCILVDENKQLPHVFAWGRTDVCRATYDLLSAQHFLVNFEVTQGG